MQIGDEGAIFLAKNLAGSIQEIGLVNCGITDKGGSEILNWIKDSPHLRMICIEENNFSSKLKLRFADYKKDQPEIRLLF